ADRPRVPRARSAPRAAAAEALHDRADVPVLGAPARALPRAWAALGRGDRPRRPGRRRRGDPALPRAAPEPRRDAVGAAAQLDRRPALPAGLPRAPERVARRPRGRPRRRGAPEARDEPAAGLRREER